MTRMNKRIAINDLKHSFRITNTAETETESKFEIETKHETKEQKTDITKHTPRYSHTHIKY